MRWLKQSARRARRDDTTRRDFIYIAAGAVAAVGAAATVWPFIDQMNPAADTRALSTTEVDLTAVAVGQQIKVMWQGKPVFVRHRTPTEIAAAQRDDFAHAEGPADRRRPHRARRWPARQARVAHPASELHALAACRPSSRARRSAAGSARATARTTTRPAASAAAPRRRISRSRRTSSSNDTSIRIG